MVIIKMQYICLIYEESDTIPAKLQVKMVASWCCQSQHQHACGHASRRGSISGGTLKEVISVFETDFKRW